MYGFTFHTGQILCISSITIVSRSIKFTFHTGQILCASYRVLGSALRNLHSTLVRFYGYICGQRSINPLFTFHTGQILWEYGDTLSDLQSEFTFHTGQILCYDGRELPIAEMYLHSTLVRFYVFFLKGSWMRMRNLHSTLVRFYVITS